MTDTKRQVDGNLAAKRLGDLLLKGYRMLDASCPHCNTVLMQAKDGQKICVLCGSNETPRSPNLIQPEVKEIKRKKSITEMEVELREISDTSSIDRAITAVLHELERSANQLEMQRNSAASVQARQELVSHIQLCAGTIKALQTLKN